MEYKEGCEANIVSIIYKDPERFFDHNLEVDDFTNNIWKVFFAIAKDILTVENKNILDDITVGLYLEKHPKLKEKFIKYGGYDLVENAGTYVRSENYDGYVIDLHKWAAVIQLAKKGYPVNERLSDFADMTADEIYKEMEAELNHIFINVDTQVKSYNAFDGLHSLVEKLDEGNGVGLPLHNADLLSREIGGLNFNGNIYGLGATSGGGKSTMAINYIFPSLYKNNEKAVFIINEEDETKIRKEMLIWVANNVFKEELHKYVLRDGNFDEPTKQLLHKCADWLEDKKENKYLTIIPLDRYSVKAVIKIIKKYNALGVRLFVLDTLKESYDSKTDDIFKSMMRDMVTLYDVVKPSAKNVGLFVTYQISKGSYKSRHYTNGDIGQAKSIVDVFSVNLMMRHPFDDEFEDGKNELSCYRLEGKNNRSKIPFKLKRDKKYLITFITKNRFGATDTFQIVSECDLSTNIYKDIGFTNVPQDF